MQIKLTKRVVEQTEPKSEDLFIWDTELPGFGVKITPKGKRIYVCQYRVNGRSRRVTLGRHGVVTIDQARVDAKAKLGEAALGGDPAAIKIEAKHGPTIAELAERYLAEHAKAKKKPLSVREDVRLLKAIIKPALGNNKVHEVTRTDVAKLHHDLRQTPYQANRTLALLRKIFNLAEKWNLRPDGTNPCQHIEQFKEQKRRRFLSVEELARLGAALAKAEAENGDTAQESENIVRLPPAAIAALRLIIFTGCRVSEVLTARWEYINWELSALVLPDSKTGFKSIPLSAPAREVIEALPVVDGNPFLIPGHKRGEHLVGLGHMWDRIRAAADIPDVRLHDLRHSYASVGAAAGLGLPIIGALLGHADPQTTARYAHLATDPLMAAAEMIGGKIDAAMKTSVSGKVSAFRKS